MFFVWYVHDVSCFTVKNIKTDFNVLQRLRTFSNEIKLAKKWVGVEVETESEITTNQRKVEEKDQNLEVDLDHEAEARKEIETGIPVEIEETETERKEEGIKRGKLEEGIENGLRPLQKMM